MVSFIMKNYAHETENSDHLQGMEVRSTCSIAGACGASRPLMIGIAGDISPIAPKKIPIIQPNPAPVWILLHTCSTSMRGQGEDKLSRMQRGEWHYHFVTYKLTCYSPKNASPHTVFLRIGWCHGNCSFWSLRQFYLWMWMSGKTIII